MTTHAAAGFPIPQQAMYPGNQKGTLIPGQVIQIQSLTVTVDRFLSQGGFAHVYLVRSATPVNGTTHHVLKRMLVADDIMLQDVKKEVDIMRILKGHANIVNLIDSAWNKLPDGRYEVFILMEYCAGGGIIDMMNRRLRERLTEAEILQIFVDVCEGVAAMHHLRPALLHRDLKVENILQSSDSLYKLCDFGSATAVSRPPTTATEMKALEYDLNRHTTLQYRAPEMVDPQLRRPIDEKSDVWALGVLLYKLCYYTTPFEEHGPLAILNVQYKIPPYPVYSQHINTLIASILREHGTQRPTVFEIRDVVHRLRGTKSRYRYTPAPSPVPALPPTPETIITYRSQTDVAASSGAAQARQKVLDAIAPMRRGRPNIGLSSDELDLITPKSSHFKSMTTTERWTTPSDPPSLPKASKSIVAGMPMEKQFKSTPKFDGHPSAWDGLGSLDQSEKDAANGFSDTFDGALSALNRGTAKVSGSALSSADIAQHSRLTMPTPSRLLQAPRPSTLTKGKEGTDQLTSNPLPALSAIRPSSASSTQNGLVSAFSRPSTAAESVMSSETGISSTAVVDGSDAMSAEERFPSIEQLEASPDQSRSRFRPSAAPVKLDYADSRPKIPTGLSKMSYTGGLSLDHSIISPPNIDSGVRSQHVTGIAMKSVTTSIPALPITPSAFTDSRKPSETQFPTAERPPAAHRRPALRKHRSSLSVTADPVSQPTTTDQVDLLGSSPPLIGNTLVTQRTPSPSAVPQRDWLTGEDIILASIPKAATGSGQTKYPALQSYTDMNKSKRASMGTVLLSNGRTAIRPGSSGAQSGWQALGISSMPTQASKPIGIAGGQTKTNQDGFSRSNFNVGSFNNQDGGLSPPTIGSNTRFRSASPGPVVGSLTDNWSPVESRFPNRFEAKNGADSSDNEEGPEDVNGIGSKRYREGGLHKQPNPVTNTFYRPSTNSNRVEEQFSPKTRKDSVQSIDLWNGSNSRGDEHPSLSKAGNDSKPYFKDLINFNEQSKGVSGTTSFDHKSYLVPPDDSADRKRTASTGSSSKEDPAHVNPSHATSFHQKRLSSSKPRPSHISLEKGRPQSLQISSAKNSPTTHADSPTAFPSLGADLPSPSSAHYSQGHHSGRRGSISDMVSRFEALSTVSGYSASSESGSTSSKPKPPVSAKPTTLRVSTAATTAAANPAVRNRQPGPAASSPVSPSAAAAVFPSIDALTAPRDPVKMNAPVKMRTSPLLFKSLDSPEEPVSTERFGQSRSNAVPPATTEPNQTRSTSSAQPITSQPTKSIIQSTSVPSKNHNTAQNLPTHDPPPVRAPTPPSPHSPTPEQPYRGVGKLIDQWQKKTEEAESKIRVGIRPGGPRQPRRDTSGRPLT